MMIIKEALIRSTDVLFQTVEEPRLEAEILLAFVLQKPRYYVYAHASEFINEDLCFQLEALIQKRKNGIPIAYLTHQKEFWSLPFEVNPHTLIPRPETELLIEITIALFKDQKKINVLDLGTGSGAIAIAIAKEKPDWTFTAVDQNPHTLDTAKLNARNNQIYSIRFLLSDWYTDLKKENTFDLIISNPPYLSDTDPHVTQGDLRYEPYAALVSGPTGLECFSSIIKDAHTYLKPKGMILLEHGCTQAKDIANLLMQYEFDHIQTHQDLQGHPRITHAMLKH